MPSLPRRLLPLLLVVATFLLPPLFGPAFGPLGVTSGHAQDDPLAATTKTVNVELILDASGSMAEALPEGETRMDAANRILRGVIEGLPGAVRHQRRAARLRPPRRQHRDRQAAQLPLLGAAGPGGRVGQGRPHRPGRGHPTHGLDPDRLCPAASGCGFPTRRARASPTPSCSSPMARRRVIRRSSRATPPAPSIRAMSASPPMSSASRSIRSRRNWCAASPSKGAASSSAQTMPTS